MERVYSYNPGAHTGQTYTRMASSGLTAWNDTSAHLCNSDPTLKDFIYNCWKPLCSGLFRSGCHVRLCDSLLLTVRAKISLLLLLLLLNYGQVFVWLRWGSRDYFNQWHGSISPGNTTILIGDNTKLSMQYLCLGHRSVMFQSSVQHTSDPQDTSYNRLWRRLSSSVSSHRDLLPWLDISESYHITHTTHMPTNSWNKHPNLFHYAHIYTFKFKIY